MNNRFTAILGEDSESASTVLCSWIHLVLPY